MRVRRYLSLLISLVSCRRAPLLPVAREETMLRHG